MYNNILCNRIVMTVMLYLTYTGKSPITDPLLITTPLVSQ